MKRKFRLPANLNVNDLNVCLTGVRGLSKVTRGVLMMYNYILSHDTRKHEAGEFAPEYTQVSRERLQSFLTKESYIAIIGQLINGGFLERLDNDADGVYYPEGYYVAPDENAGIVGRCKSFRIPAQLTIEGRKYQWYEMVLTKTELNRIANIQQSRIQYEETYRDYIRGNMENIVLVDSAGSRQAITQLYAAKSVRVDADRFLDMWNNQVFHDVTTDAFGRRVHGPITSAPRELRPFMRFNTDLDSPLVEIDFVASQPSLLASITPKVIMKFAPECASAIPLFRDIEGDANWELYKATCLDTRPGHGIYEFLAQAFEAEYGVPMTRDQGKDIYYRACFSNYKFLATLNVENAEIELDYQMINGGEKQREEAASNLFTLRSYHVFKKAFPRVHRLFKDLKNLTWKIEGQGKPHSNNCLLAQRVESGLVYTGLVKALKENGIEKMVTIHDAIFLRVQDEARARKIIQKELDRLKLNLKLKTK